MTVQEEQGYALRNSIDNFQQGPTGLPGTAAGTNSREGYDSSRPVVLITVAGSASTVEEVVAEAFHTSSKVPAGNCPQ
jgi:hypothetical protein